AYLAGLMQQVHPESAFRDHASAMLGKASAAQASLSLNRDVYNALASLDTSQGDAGTRYYVQRTLLELRLAGVNKDDATRARLKQLNEQLTNQESMFGRNIDDDKRSVEISDRSELEGLPEDYGAGNFSPVGSGFVAANSKSSINGYIYGTGPPMTMKKGERVRWYLVSLGEFFSMHSPHWHGNVVLQDGKRTDVVSLMPAQMVTVDMVPDNPGIWMFHCHVDEHMEGGMASLYKVEP